MWGEWAPSGYLLKAVILLSYLCYQDKATNSEVGHVPCLHLKKILVASQIISTDSEMGPAVYMLWANNAQYQSICFAPDASIAIPFYILGVLDVQVGLKYVET